MKTLGIGIIVVAACCSLTALAWSQADRQGWIHHQDATCNMAGDGFEGSLPVQNTNDGEIDLSKQAERTVVFTQGYQTDPRDGGRPVGLIAAALGVENEVFRNAFAGVSPARGGRPSPSHARANKKVLMDALQPHGVTNDRLDEVSNHYRYRPESGELWSHLPAKASPVIEDGKLVGVNVDDGGHGYLSPPNVVVAGFEDVRLECNIEFSEDIASNGRVVSIEIVN